MQRFFLAWVMGLAFCVSAWVNAVELKPTAPLGVEASVPHIALLLPLKSAAFRSAANAVQQGFVAAHSINPQALPVRVYGCADESREVIALYAQAVAKGAVAVVGPLTRNGVSLLAAQPNIPVPTLALNALEGKPSNLLYGFGMAVEAEARLVAQLAAQNGLRQAIVIGSMAPFDLRMQFAFEEAWNAQGGTVKQEIEFNGDPAQLADLKIDADTVIFLAGNAQQARLMRPYLPKKVPIYATSQLFASNTPTNFELNGIRFVDMPWLLQPDHPAVMIYPHANPALSIDLERLYALGVDAYRLVQILLDQQQDSALPLEGVSGQIRLNGHQFQRSALPATFAQGKALPLDAAPSLPEPTFFPAQAINRPSIDHE